MVDGSTKNPLAFRTITELAEEIGVPQHILRYWEARFPKLSPLQRAGKRRYYRPEDVVLAHEIDRLINREGYSVKRAQEVLGVKNTSVRKTNKAPVATPSLFVSALCKIREQLARALAEDDIAARI